MGWFVYAEGPNESYRLDDRVVAHLELAIGVKLRRNESFAFTLVGDDIPAGRGRHVFWMHPAVAVQFQYDGDRSTIAVNPTWVEALVAAASDDHGLRIVAEPAPAPPPTGPLLG